jgi:hypothetical protein
LSVDIAKLDITIEMVILAFISTEAQHVKTYQQGWLHIKSEIYLTVVCIRVQAPRNGGIIHQGHWYYTALGPFERCSTAPKMVRCE